jgi:hypothetical protein
MRLSEEAATRAREATGEARPQDVAPALATPDLPWAAPTLSLRQRAVVDGLTVAGIAWFIIATFVWGEPAVTTPFVDGLAYWSVDTAAPYDTASVGGTGSFLYSPFAAMAFGIVGLLPKPVFVLSWALTIVALSAWLGRPWPRIWLILLLPLSREVLIGQFNMALTAAIVLGFGRPWLWSIVLLTKITPGVGLLWFAVRREWRHLAIALVATALLIAASFALRPDWWIDWLRLLSRDQSVAAHQLPWVRYGLAAAIVVWGARTDRPWVVPLGAFLALPVIYPDSFTFLAGCVAVRYASIRLAALGPKALAAPGSGGPAGNSPAAEGLLSIETPG